MQRHLSLASFALLFSGSFALAQSPTQTPPSQEQLTPQVLGEMLRTAATFSDLVRSINLNKTFGPDQHVMGPDGQLHHPMDRTAKTIGAGVGAGVAIGAMTHNQNGVLIGALIGGAGGLIVDQILQHREVLREKALRNPGPDVPNDPHLEFKQRDPRSEPPQGLKDRN